jgi:hypothetical protein
MSRAGARGARKPLPPGSELNWQKAPGELPDNAPTPLFPVCYSQTIIDIYLEGNIGAEFAI